MPFFYADKLFVKFVYVLANAIQDDSSAQSLDCIFIGKLVYKFVGSYFPATKILLVNDL